MNSPSVSVLLPVYNSAEFLHEAIRSILKQTFKGFELIIIDDGSTDNSYEIARYYAAIDDRVSVFKQDNKGISQTRNRLILLSKAKYIAWMDSDDISAPYRLEYQCEYLGKNSDVVALGGGTEFIDDKNMKLCKWKVPLLHNEIDKWHINGRGGAIIFASSMMVKSAVVKAGGFDESLTGAEDLCLFLRLAEIGKLANLDEVVYLYRQHINSISHKDKMKIFSDKNKVIGAAHRRRGDVCDVFLNSEVDARVKIDLVQPHQVYNKWAWWALNDGNVNACKKYALKAVISKPYCLAYWKTLYCAWRGY